MEVGHTGLEHNVNKWQNFHFLHELFHWPGLHDLKKQIVIFIIYFFYCDLKNFFLNVIKTNSELHNTAIFLF